MGRPHFPRNLLEFQIQFGTEEACLEYLVASRWPDGFHCPRCGGGKAYPVRSRLLWQCAVPNCRLRPVPENDRPASSLFRRWSDSPAPPYGRSPASR